MDDRTSERDTHTHTHTLSLSHRERWLQYREHSTGGFPSNVHALKQYHPPRIGHTPRALVLPRLEQEEEEDDEDLQGKHEKSANKMSTQFLRISPLIP